MHGPVHRDRLTPPALAIEAGLARRPSMVTTTPKMKNRPAMKVRRSRSLARRSACGSGTWVSVWSMGEVMVVLPALQELESDVEQGAQDNDADAHGQRLAVPRMPDPAPVANFQAVDEPLQLVVGLAGFELGGHHRCDGAGDEG